jgi:hypothetical protein
MQASGPASAIPLDDVLVPELEVDDVELEALLVDALVADVPEAEVVLVAEEGAAELLLADVVTAPP